MVANFRIRAALTLICIVLLASACGDATTTPAVPTPSSTATTFAPGQLDVKPLSCDENSCSSWLINDQIYERSVNGVALSEQAGSILGFRREGTYLELIQETTRAPQGAWLLAVPDDFGARFLLKGPDAGTEIQADIAALAVAAEFTWIGDEAKVVALVGRPLRLTIAVQDVPSPMGGAVFTEFAECNRSDLTYAETDAGIEFVIWETTQIGCEPESQYEEDDRATKLLATVNGAHLEGELLVLDTPDGGIRLDKGQP